MAAQERDAEALQKLVARLVATHPVGRDLMLIGGFRYRFLNKSVRTSDDIDYHWSGDLFQKQADLVDFLNRAVIPEARRLLGYDGDAASHLGPDADSPAVRIVDLAFWRQDEAYSRIEIPVEITRIMCADAVTVRTVDGTIYATASDADMIESKVIAVFNRLFIRHRDIVDLFLFQEQLTPTAGQRVASKLAALGVPPDTVAKRMSDFRTYAEYHGRATQAVIDSQLDPAAADQLNAAGGGTSVMVAVLGLLSALVEGYDENA